ncbi:hypothetical protein [uncultured Aquimarina sp.]|uniref:hypothetical protein n=1 Tax=uncultured Aquimarina sp. TaxID=575652 RepID=UPI002620629D|nr:hypothetical protein [uncultured Aquimarina sp.]
MNLYQTIQNSKAFLSDSWKERYGGFLQEEHIWIFAKTLERYNQFGVPEAYPLPHFNEEITPSPTEVFKNFEEVLEHQNTTPKDWAKRIETIPFEYLLILIGQRCTSATLKNKNAIPPIKETLLDSCFAPFNDQICIATRAWEKHIGRSEDDFWGEMRGNPVEKEQKVKKRILEIIANKTWWNIFYHYKHKFVYEIRVPSGHGIRWNAEGTKLIGFLEPFL